MEQDLSRYRKTKFLKYILFSHYKIQQTTTFFRKYLLIPISLNSDYSFGKLELVLDFWIWILACLLGCWGLGLAGIDQDVTDDFSKDPFTIDVTQHDICPTLWPIDHIIYGHGQPLKD